MKANLFHLEELVLGQGDHHIARVVVVFPFVDDIGAGRVVGVQGVVAVLEVVQQLGDLPRAAGERTSSVVGVLAA